LQVEHPVAPALGDDHHVPYDAMEEREMGCKGGRERETERVSVDGDIERKS
jgi:hypothetical protein